MKGWMNFLLALVLTGLICVATAGAGGTQDASAAQKTKISIATVIPPGTPFPLGLEHMSKALNETGKFETAVYPGSQLGSLLDVLDRCLAGDPVIMTCDPGEMADLGVPDIAAAQIPFFYDTWDQVDKITSSDWYKNCAAQVEKKGMKILASNWGFGDRYIISRTPITKLSDLAGKKIRVPANVNFVKSLNALGAAATPLALGEVFTALQQGVLDGMENPYSDIYANKIYEVAKYCVEEDHVKEPGLIICGTDFFNTLSAEQQNILIQQAEESGKYQRSLLEKTSIESKAKLAAAGVIFTKIDRLEFIAAVDKNYYPLFTDWTPGLKDTLKAIIAK
jgi:TRAP-type C4-dicarboxylate transport system substrate-binding protein